MPRLIEVSTVVNGRPWSGEVPPRQTLADFLRDNLRLTGTHLGCEQGVCGACTVLLDGEDKAAAHDGTVEPHRAGAADALLASDMCSGQPLGRPKKIGEVLAHRHPPAQPRAVQGERDLARLAHASSLASTRRFSTCAR